MIRSLPKSLVEFASRVISKEFIPAAFVHYKDQTSLDEDIDHWAVKNDNNHKAIDNIDFDATHTEDDKTHLYRYTAASTELNRALFRAHKEGQEVPNEFHSPNNFHFKNVTHDLKGLDAAVGRNKLDHDLVSYSGIRWEPSDKIGPDGKVHLPAYTSTTLNKDTALSFTAPNKDTQHKNILQITSRKGSTGIYTHNDPSMTFYPSESEFLIPRKTTLKVNPVPEVHEGGFHIWHAERLHEEEPEVDTNYVSPEPSREQIYENGKLKVFKVNKLSGLKEHYPKMHEKDGGETFHSEMVNAPFHVIHTPEGKILHTGTDYDDESDKMVRVFKSTGGDKYPAHKVLGKYPELAKVKHIFE